jgi:hypothetical protein
MTPKAASMKPFAAGLGLLGLAAVFAGGCGESPKPSGEPSAAVPTAVPVETAPERAITRLHPAEARRGATFNRQPNGSSAIAVSGAGFVRGDQVHWGDQPLKTVFGDEATLTAEVPKELLDRVGEVTISVRNPSDREIREVQAVFRLLPAEQRAAE